MTTIEPAVAADDRAVARLHAEEIGAGFLASLGERFLGRLYRRVRLWPGSFVVVARHDSGAVAGFVAGTESTGGLYRAFLRRDGIAAAAMAGRHLLGAVGPALETMRYGFSSQAGLPAAELLALAVDPEFRRQGVGLSLVAEFRAEMVRRGVDRARVVVGRDNTGAIELYRAGGFEPYGRGGVHADSPSEVMVWSRP